MNMSPAIRGGLLLVGMVVLWSAVLGDAFSSCAPCSAAPGGELAAITAIAALALVGRSHLRRRDRQTDQPPGPRRRPPPRAPNLDEIS